MAERPIPLGAGLADDDLRQRDLVLAEGGPLAAAMRANELRAWTPATWLGEVWRWVIWMRVVRGFRAETTCAAYAESIGHFAMWVHDRGAAFDALAAADLDEWQKSLFLTRRMTAPSRLRALAALRSFYGWRSTRGLGVDVTAGYRGPRTAKRMPRKYTTAQLRAMFDGLRKHGQTLLRLRDETVLLFLLCTGLRREEMANLRIDQLDIAERAGLVRVFGKGAKERMVPFEGPVVKQMQRWLLERAEIPGLCTDRVFVGLARNWRGKPMAASGIEGIVARAARRAGLKDWGVHRFRVTFATQLYDDGVDIERIRVLMGHESIETTRRYLSVSQRLNQLRLKPYRQHQAMGTFPEDLPLWAKHLESMMHGNPLQPTR